MSFYFFKPSGKSFLVPSTKEKGKEEMKEIKKDKKGSEENREKLF